MPRSLTVGQLIHQLQPLDPDHHVRLAIAPDWPFSHFLGLVLEGPGPSGPTAYIAEDGQEGYLPPPVADALGWPTDATEPRDDSPTEDGEPWFLDGQDAAHLVTELLDHHPGWTTEEYATETVYTSPGAHLTVRLAPSGWSLAAHHRTPDGATAWEAHFDPAVPPTAIKAFLTTLLGPEPTV
ncbi:DUF317 domain-containing protein [Streptomyces sp. B1866]|uniref:DUF317 domain-containing protein n=1 Tax=Streptomyces sp. B1866 TaxID=3075431 RepID=UPI00288CE4FE|nr:DUF317 domain-containing protein [Streptomyces sp. B1866]MDT3395314.1 DUF317 domain-containing protein [Streptomyces sp. B1866]